MEGRTSRSNNVHNRRYRASCDYCTDSKLKCDQVKPQCNRCTSRGRACVYSLIRAVGRPPRSNACVNNSIRRAVSEADSSKNASQTIHTTNVDKSPTRSQDAPETLINSSETSSPCQVQSTIEPHTLDISMGGNFEFGDSSEPLGFQAFSFDDISLGEVMDSSMPINGADGIPNVDPDDLTLCCMDQLDTDPMTAAQDSINTPRNDFAISPGTQSTSLTSLAEIPAPATTEKSAAKTGLSSPLFSVDRLSDIAPSKLHRLMMEICPESQPSLRIPLAGIGEKQDDSSRCICPALVGSLQVFASNPALSPGPQGLIRLDLLLLLDDQLWQTQHAISKCRSCGQFPSNFQKMTLCTMADWMADNWKTCLQQRLVRPRTSSYFRNCEEMQPQPSPSPAGAELCCLRLGPTRINDITWRICLQNLVRLRLIRLTQLIQSVSCGAGHSESSRSKPSTLKLVVNALKQETNSKIQMALGMMDSCR